MYEAFFGLQERPFVTVPSPQSYFPGNAIEQARQGVSRIVQRGGGPAMVVGPVGTGKTLLCRILARQLRQTFRVALLSSTRVCTRRGFLQAVLFELALPYRDLDEGELRLALTGHATSAELCPKGLVLLLDEADRLPRAVLEEIRMLTNVLRDELPCIQPVLVGGRQLEELVNDPRLESLHQRIAGRFYLEPFSQEETVAYVQSRLSSSGSFAHELFTPEALLAVYRATGGIPRLVNQVCEHAMMLAFVGQNHQIGEEAVQEAWSDLQQIPALDAASDETSNVIEFGSLEEDDEQQSMGTSEPDVVLEEIEHHLQQLANQDPHQNPAGEVPDPAATEGEPVDDPPAWTDNNGEPVWVDNHGGQEELPDSAPIIEPSVRQTGIETNGEEFGLVPHPMGFHQKLDLPPTSTESEGDADLLQIPQDSELASSSDPSELDQEFTGWWEADPLLASDSAEQFIDTSDDPTAGLVCEISVIDEPDQQQRDVEMEPPIPLDDELFDSGTFNPFSEPFDDEEIVLDTQSLPSPLNWQALPRVESPLSRHLAQQLEQLASSTHVPRVDVGAETAPRTVSDPEFPHPGAPNAGHPTDVAAPSEESGAERPDTLGRILPADCDAPPDHSEANTTELLALPVSGAPVTATDISQEEIWSCHAAMPPLSDLVFFRDVHDEVSGIQQADVYDVLLEGSPAEATVDNEWFAGPATHSQRSQPRPDLKWLFSQLAAR